MDGFMLFTAASISIFQEKRLMAEIHHCVTFTLVGLHLPNILCNSLFLACSTLVILI